MKMFDFRTLLKKTVELIAEKPDELDDEAFDRFIVNIDLMNKLLKRKKVKEIIDEIDA